VKELNALVAPYDAKAPRKHSGDWSGAFAKAKLFSRLEKATFSHVHRGSSEAEVDRVASISVIAALSEAEREGVLTQVRTLLRDHPQTRGKHELEAQYDAEVYWCQRLT
jgi:hypothetical protein